MYNTDQLIALSSHDSLVALYLQAVETLRQVETQHALGTEPYEALVAALRDCECIRAQLAYRARLFRDDNYNQGL